jgi:hypothetical protein
MIGEHSTYQGYEEAENKKGRSLDFQVRVAEQRSAQSGTCSQKRKKETHGYSQTTWP